MFFSERQKWWQQILNILQFFESPFTLIRFPSIVSQILHEPTERYVKLRNDRLFSNHYQIIIHSSFNYTIIHSDTLYSDFVNRITNEMKNRASVLTAVDNSKDVATLIPTLLQSKSVSVDVWFSQSPETSAKLAISPKTIISNILASIPVIYKNK
jgi:hypothetical protein